MIEPEGVVAMCQEAIDNGVVPGIALSYGKRSDSPTRCILGSAQLKPAYRQLSGATHFDLASLTKVLATTWLTMNRWEAGLDLDAPLQDLIPGYYPVDKGKLTIRLLLTHSAGLPSGLRLRDQMDAPTAAEPETRSRAMEHFLEAPCRTEPGQDTLYSDIGPILVGDLLEQLAMGERLDQLCERELYRPSEMPDTGFLPLIPGPARVSPVECAATEDCPWRGRVVSGQVHDENAYLLNGVAGHAGLFAPLADIERAARGFLAPEASGTFPQKGVTEFTRRQSIVPESSRALGWDTAHAGCPGGDRLSTTAFGHTGFTGTSIWIDPEQGFYVVLLTNRVHPSRDNSRFVAFRPRLHDRIANTLCATP